MERYFSHNHFASPEHTHKTRAEVSCLKVVNYTDSRCNSVEECSLPDDEGILNFVNGQGQFAPKKVPDGVTIKGQVRCLILYEPKLSIATLADETQDVWFLPPSTYQVIIESLRLPLLSLDIDRTIGSFFNLEFAEENNESLMRLVFRHQFQRTDMQMRDFPEPTYSHCYKHKIELFLTYSFSSNETTALFRLNEGFERLEMRQDMSKCFDEISRITCKVAHPLTLPYIMIRSVRLRLNQRHLDAASMAEQMELILACNTSEVKHDARRIYTNTSDSWNFRPIGRHWADNRRSMISVLSSAAALCEAIDELREAMACFWSRLSDKEKSSEMTAIHTQLARGLKDERAQLGSIVGLTRQLEQRMHALESSIHIMALEHSQRNSQLNMATAQWQIDLSITTTKDAKTMKGLAFMGALFLPGTFMSAIFSMPFFEFKSDKLWVYFAAAVPLTTLTIAVWVIYEILQQRKTRADHGFMKEVTGLLRYDVDSALRKESTPRPLFPYQSIKQGPRPTVT